MKRETSTRVTMYMPDRLMNQFRDHCSKNGLIMSATIALLLKEYMRKENGNA